MSETKIIPVELRKLVCWRVCQSEDNSRDELVKKFMAATMTPRAVSPLDMRELRKTQRRVATLLGQSPRLALPNIDGRRRRDPPTLCYVCRRTESGGGSVWAGSLDHSEQLTDKHTKSRTGQWYSVDHNQGGLCGERSSDQWKKYRVLPLVINTTDTNKRSYVKEAWTSRDHTDRPGLRADSQVVNERNRHKSTRFVASRENLLDLDPNLQSLQDWVLRSNTLESQKTGDSLRVDEDYVPMSVAVRKLTTLDLATDGKSPYQEFAGFFTGSSTESLARTRENTLLSIYTDSSSSSIVTRDRSAVWCTCPEDTSIVLTSDARHCPECKMVDSKHEDWYLSRGDHCLHCRRPILRSRDDHSSDRSPVAGGSVGERRDGNLSRKSTTLFKLSSQSARVKDWATEYSEVTRVRFAETVQEKVISRNSHSDPSPEVTSREPRSSRSLSGHACVRLYKNSDSVTHNTRRDMAERVGTSRISPNIHRDAYNLAVKVAHAQIGPHGRKKKKKKKGAGNDICPTTGIVFSYFPLLKRPLNSETAPDQTLNVGLRQHNGPKLKLKHAMKHILGTTKLSDYYPGGKRYLSRY